MLKEMKIYVPTPEISEKVQKKLFEMGYVWVSGDDKVMNKNAHYLYADIDGEITFGDDFDLFHEEEYPEVKWQDLLYGNLMPKLEAGKHVVEIESGKLFYVLSSEDGELFGISVEGDFWASGFRGEATPVKIYTITAPTLPIKENLKLIWGRRPPKTDTQIKYEELCDKINELQKQAEELKGEI